MVAIVKLYISSYPYGRLVSKQSVCKCNKNSISECIECLNVFELDIYTHKKNLSKWDLLTNDARVFLRTSFTFLNRSFSYFYPSGLKVVNLNKSVASDF